ncbi:MAG: bifunctional UDP-N-acetylglucosamine diphosphorylase/glucosamine-1-phosphate N-acetyltransferase GlmU [Cyanobacteriota bacterium]
MKKIENLSVIIMAAGKGTRMKSSLPKVLHTVSGKPMLEYVIDSVSKFEPDNVFVIVGHGLEQVKSYFSKNNKITWVEQKEQLGTGHAVMQVFPYLEGYKGNVLILSGDVPLLSNQTIENIFDVHEKEKADATVLTTIMNNPFGYGRIIKSSDENITKIVEEKDSNVEEKKVREINSGTYYFNWDYLNKFLNQITPKNAQGEYYLTDVIKLFVDNNLKVKSSLTNNIEEVTGINDRMTLAEIEKIMQDKIIQKLMVNGVTIKSSTSTFIESEVKIGNDTIINPNTMIEGNTIIGSNCVIGPNIHIKDSIIKDNSNVSFMSIKNSEISENLTLSFSEVFDKKI